MKKENKSFMETYRQVRKPMPPSEKVIANIKDLQKKERFDWRRGMEDEDDGGDDYKGIGETIINEEPKC